MAISFDFGVVNFGSINEGGFATNPVPLGVEFSENSSIGTDTLIWTIIRDAYPTASFTETTFTLDFLYPDFANSDFESATVEIRRNDSTQFQAQIALFTNDDNLDEPDEAFSLQQPTVVVIDIRDGSGALLARLFPDDIAALYASVGGLTAIGQVTGTIIDNDLPPNTAPTAINFINTTPDLDENSDTADRIKVADITITDDGKGTNNLSLTGTDAGVFELDGSTLYLKAGTVLDYESGKTSYSVTVNVDDPTVGNPIDASNTFTLNINDLPENRTPTAVNDSVNAYRGVPTTIAASTLLANDTDPDAGTTLQITGVSNATNGTVSLNSSGNVVFTATNTGDASFQYTISDGSLTSTATVAVSVGLSLNGGNGIDILKGSDRDDLINGNGGADALYGNKGNDILNGGSSLDLLLGGEGNDLLNGGDSADALYGGKGNDTLTGGSGKDLFAFVAGDGSDTITDFADGSDKIGLVGLRFSQLTISASGSGTVIKYGSETLATLTGVSSSLITAADFIPA